MHLLGLLLLALFGCVETNPVAPEREFLKPPGKLYMIASYYQEDFGNNIASEVIYHYYDSEERIIREAYSVPNRSPYKFKDYEYLGDIVYIKTKEEENGAITSCLKQRFENGKLSKVSGCDEKSHNYKEFIYDNDGNLIEEILYNINNGERNIVKRTTYEYQDGKLHYKFSPPFSYEYIYSKDKLKEVIDMDGKVAIEKFFYDDNDNLFKKEEWYYDHGFYSYYLNYTRLYCYYE